MRDRTGNEHRHGLGQISAHQDRRAQQRIEKKHHGDDQRAGADRGHADDGTDEEAEDDRAHDLHGHVSALLRLLATNALGASRHEVLRDHCRQGQDQHPADPGADRLAGLIGVQHLREDQGADEHAGDRAGRQPADQAPVHGLRANVHPRTDRLHDRGGHDIAGDGGGGVDAEDEHEHRGHQGCAAHAGQSDHDPGDQAAEGKGEVDVSEAHGGEGSDFPSYCLLNR